MVSDKPVPSADAGVTSGRTKGTLRYLATAVKYTAFSVLFLGLVYPLVLAGIGYVLFPKEAAGSLLAVDGKIVGSNIIGQLWTKPRYFAGRPSAAGKNGYDPTATGGTNLGPASRKLLDATRATIVLLQRSNPAAAMPLPMDLVTASSSGIDPDISPEAALYQAPRIAQARHVPLAAIVAMVDRHVRDRELGFLGAPRVNVLELNLALDGKP